MNAAELAEAYRKTGGAPVEVTIFCNEESHNGKRYDVYQFGIDELGEQGSPPTWLGGTRRADGPGKLKGASHTRAILVDDRYISAEEQRADKSLIHREPIRTRYAFECDVCGLKVVRHKGPLFAALDKLALAGESQISIAGLAAIVGK